MHSKKIAPQKISYQFRGILGYPEKKNGKKMMKNTTKIPENLGI